MTNVLRKIFVMAKMEWKLNGEFNFQKFREINFISKEPCDKKDSYFCRKNCQIDNLFYQGHGHDKVRQFWLFMFTKQKYLAFSGNYCVSYSKARDNGRVSLLRQNG